MTKPSVLMLHNRYLIRGGEDESTDLEVAMLRDNGHHVELFEVHNRDPRGVADKAGVALSAIWSRAAFRAISEKLALGQYDLVHVQNFFPLLSPSVYAAAKKANVPVVQAVRNYRLICPSANLFRDGRFCDDCVGKAFAYPAIAHACYRSSRLGTASLAAMLTANKVSGNWAHGVDRYIALTDYVRLQLERGGFPGQKIVVKPNFVKLLELDSAERPTRDFAMYVGRLTEEKGAYWLIRNWKQSNISLPLRLIGEGDVTELLHGAEDIVEAVGKKSIGVVYKTMANARFVVLPSLWPEPFGRVIVEAFANGTPVLAARTGGVHELVEDGKNGFLYDPSNSADFVSKARLLSRDDALIARMGKVARETYETRYTAKVNYDILSKIYSDVLAERCGVSTHQL